MSLNNYKKIKIYRNNNKMYKINNNKMDKIINKKMNKIKYKMNKIIQKVTQRNVNN